MANLNRQELYRLEIFCEIVKEGGISNAVVTTGKSQPVLSNMLSELESILGVTLCRRGRSGFELTHEGRVVYDQSIQLFNTLDKYAETIKGVKNTLSGDVRVGMLDNIATNPECPIIPAMEDFYEMSDSVSVSLVIKTFEDLYRDFNDRQLDIVIATSKESLSFATGQDAPSFKEQSYFYARNDVAETIEKNNYSLAGQNVLNDDYVLEWISTELVSEQDAVNIVDVSSIETMLMSILSGTHVGFLPEHVVTSYQFAGHLKQVNPEKWQYVTDWSVIANQKDLATAGRVFYERLAENCE